MRKARSHFRLGVLGLVGLLLSSCASHGRDLSVVDEQTYKNPSACWLESGNELRAFLVLAKDGRELVPYLVSAKCVVMAKYNNLGESTYDLISALRVSDDYHVLQARLGHIVADNVRTDLPAPEKNDLVYFVRGSLVHQAGKRYYKIGQIKELKYTRVSFGKLLSMSLHERTEFSRKFM